MARLSTTTAPGKRSLFRRRRRLILVAVVVAAPVFVWLAADRLATLTADRRYLAAVAEADRLDPGWREGYVPASVTPVPDDQNSARLVRSAARKVSPGWSALKGKWPPLVLDPAKPLSAEMLAELRGRRDEAAGALGVARALADLPRGRFPDWKVEVIHKVPDSRAGCREGLRTALPRRAGPDR